MHLIKYVDADTEELLSHLRELAQNETAEDILLVRSFAAGIDHHEPSLYSFRDAKSKYKSLYNPVIKNLVSLLLRVIDTASSEYADLLRQLVNPLPFDEIYMYIGDEAMIKLFSNTRILDSTLEILLRNVRTDDSARAYLTHSDLLPRILAQMLHDETEQGIVWFFMYYMMEVVAANGMKADKFSFLVEFLEEHILSPKHIGSIELLENYSVAVSYVANLDFSDVTWGPKLFSLPFEKLRAFEPSPTKNCCIASYAEKLASKIGIVSFAWIKPFFASLLDHVVRNCSNILQDSSPDNYVCAYQTALVHLLREKGEPLEFVLDFLSRHNLDILDTGDRSSIRVFGKLPLHNLPRKSEFFDRYFADLDVPADDGYYIDCVFALVRDEDFFNLMVKANMLTLEIVGTWPPSIQRCFLDLLSDYDYASQHMITHFFPVLATVLLSANANSMDKGLSCSLARTLRKLLRERDIDLGIWESGLARYLDELENGPWSDSLSDRRF